MRSELLGFGVAADGQLGIRPGSEEHGGVTIPEHIVGAPCGHDGCSVVDVAAGEKHTVLLADDGKVWSVGGNDEGQLGRGECSATGSYTIYPVPVPTSTKFVQVSSGRAHSAALTEDGRLFVWGANGQGQCGVPGKMVWEKPKRVQELNEVVQVACGPDHTTVLTESGRIFTFGLQYDGACVHEPKEVQQLIGLPVVSIHAGGRHWAVLSASGTVAVWGKNDAGQLGTGDTMFRPKPVILSCLSEMRVVDIALGDSHSLFLTMDGRVFACGADAFGQIGAGKRQEVNSTPKAILDLMGSHVTRIAAGRVHSLVTVEGRVFSFGLNSSGQLGQGNTRTLITPRPIEGMDHVARLFAGWDQSFMLRAAGVASLKSGPSVVRRPIRTLQWDAKKGETMLTDKVELIGQLESVFQSLSSINGSFLYKDDKRMSCSSSNHCVALDDAMEYFNVIANAPAADRKTLMDVCIDMLDMSLFTDRPPKKYIHPECLRVFLIVPWLDAFVHPTLQIAKTFHIKFCEVLGDVTEEHFYCLSQWWLDVPVRHFRRLIVGLLAALQKIIEESQGEAMTKEFEILLSALSMLHALNAASNRLSQDTFYIPNLTDRVNLQQDYVNWAHSDPKSMNTQFFWMKYPFIMNGVAKGELLHVDSKLQQRAAAMETSTLVPVIGPNGGIGLALGDPYFSFEVSRETILTDTLDALLREHPQKMRRPLRVSFKSEEAEDRGGVRKEFFMILFEKLLSPDYGMFSENEESRLSWFSGMECDDSSFNLVGILTALAIYNEILVPFPFPIGMFKLFLNRDLTLEDLAELSPTEGKNLQALLDYEGEDVEEVFCLTFTIGYTFFGEAVTEELKKGGDKITVTSSNRQEYVNLYVKKRMAEGRDGVIKKQSRNFCEGFFSIVHSRVINLFQPSELMELVIGNENYDWDLFKKNMQYKGVYHANHPTILAFWEAFSELSLDERKTFLQFLSGTYRLPVHGFKGFESYIQPTADHLLPVAHTCFNLLDLPDLADKKEQLRRLRVSIQQPTGFSLV